jgi:hypothetical protein
MEAIVRVNGQDAAVCSVLIFSLGWRQEPLLRPEEAASTTTTPGPRRVRVDINYSTLDYSSGII